MNGLLLEARKIIADEFPFESIYLPTYRRIEEDLKSLTNLDSAIDLNKTSIQFGMNDVQNTFDKITTEIKESTIQWFSIINSEMLAQLIKGFTLTDELQKNLEDKDALGIVLDRIGDNITPQNKKSILKLINGKPSTKSKQIAFFLANLVQAYYHQKDNDNAIKLFSNKCNQYLRGKRIVYNDRRVEISIKRNKDDSVVDIHTLSSGEKQIISLFARLFLSKLKSVAIFFDEPELSLSIEWQKTLLPDILESGMCGFLFCTTHSPFIFENDLIRSTSDLDLYIEDSQ